MDDDWLPYLRDAFASFNMDMRVPMLAKPDELARFYAPTMVITGDRDVSFPGEKLIERARALFPSLTDHELLRDCRHSPPTTDDFRRWMSLRLTDFLLAKRAMAAAS